MPSFVWKGRTRTGQSQEGVLLADSRNAAVATLRRQQITVTSIREKGRELPLLPCVRRLAAGRIGWVLGSRGGSAFRLRRPLCLRLWRRPSCGRLLRT